MTMPTLLTSPVLAPWIEYWLSWLIWRRLLSIWLLVALVAVLLILGVLRPYQQQVLRHQQSLQQLQQLNHHKWSQLAQYPSLIQLQQQIAESLVIEQQAKLPLQQQLAHIITRGEGILLAWQPSTTDTSPPRVVLQLDYARALQVMVDIQRQPSVLPISQLMLFAVGKDLHLQLQLTEDLTHD